MSPGTKFDKNIMLLTQTSQSNYEELCRLDVMGLHDMPDHDQSMVIDGLLTPSPKGWYETTLRGKLTTQQGLQNPADWESYKAAWNKAVSLLKRAKSQFFKTTLKHNKHNPKGIWRTIKSLISVDKQQSIHRLRIDGHNIVQWNLN